FSSLTRNQIVSAALTFVGMLAWLAPWYITRDLPQDSTKFVILKHLSFVHLWIDALKGQLHLRDIIIQAPIALFGTFLTVKVLEARRWACRRPAARTRPTPNGFADMSSAEPTAPTFVSALVTQRRQVAIGLAVAGAILAGLAIWWGIWGFARSAD